jgi:hypothetical protein
MRRWLLCVLAACGGGDSSDDRPDAPPIVDAAVDAPPMVTCNFTEAADATNNSSPGAEATMQTFGSAKTTICGNVNNGHFNQGVVDVDAYKVAVSGDTDVLVHLTGAGIEALGRVVIQVGTTGGQQRNLGVFEGDHATTSVRLPAGEYVFAVTALNQADTSAPIPYSLAIVADAPATRCAKVTAAASFTEANDGPANNGNDMITSDAAANPETELTVSPTDNPEPTNLTLAAGTQYRLAGSSAAVDPTDDYEDRDTFVFTTGPTTTQLSIRLNWASTTVDFDYRVFPPNVTLSVTGALASSLAEDEFQTFAVKPNTMYWLWVGAYDGASGQPATYDATLCAETFAP